LILKQVQFTSPVKGYKRNSSIFWRKRKFAGLKKNKTMGIILVL
jgi:hypothetical protein